ncbi:NAD(+)--rifampin ADP-ribosyltransferase [Agreia sp.]|uniref:NAD(+)--rifampin ADP-ribosyltransferase n=1 Tax=Agreia sp. TaxID=1872416 RepID=UPI0035BC5ED7
MSTAVDHGPFFHGTKADLHIGYLLEAGRRSNVTDKKFSGNPTRSYRSREPLRVVVEVTDWTRLTSEALQAWHDRLAVLRADERGEIVN